MIRKYWNLKAKSRASPISQNREFYFGMYNIYVFKIKLTSEHAALASLF